MKIFNLPPGSSRKNNPKRKRKKGKLQSVVVKKTPGMTETRARSIAKKRGYKIGRMEETGTSYRFRQLSKKFRAYRTKRIGRRISLVYGKNRKK